MSITKAQAKLLQLIITDRYLGSGTRFVSAYSAEKRLLDQIKSAHPDAIAFHYGGETIGNGKHVGTVGFNTTPAAVRLLDEYDKTAVVGFEGSVAVEDGRGLSTRKDFHYRAESESQLRQAIRRGCAFYHKFEIIELRMLTHAQWVTAYGWGRM